MMPNMILFTIYPFTICSFGNATAKLHKKNDIRKLYVIFPENYFIFLLEELVHVLVYDDLLLEDVSPCFRRLNHLDALRVRASGVTGVNYLISL